MNHAIDPAMRLIHYLGPWLSIGIGALLMVGLVVAVGVWSSLRRMSRALERQNDAIRYGVQVLKWMGTQRSVTGPPLEAGGAMNARIAPPGAPRSGEVPLPQAHGALPRTDSPAWLGAK